MKIIILGGGQIGKTVAQNLVAQSSSNDVTVIDIDEAPLTALSNDLDIQTIVGDASSPSILQYAGAEDAELLLALTGNDSSNLIACRLAKQLFNIPNRIARIRYGDIIEYTLNPDESNQDKTSLSLFDVTDFICPEQLVTEQLFELFQYSSALQVLNFEDSNVQMVVVKAKEGGQLVGHQLGEIYHDLTDDIDCFICAIYRNDGLIIPTEKTKIISGDEVFFFAKKEQVQSIMNALRPEEKTTRKIMIAGGGNIGYRLAKTAENLFDIKIIEINDKRSEWLSEKLDATLVLNGSSTDENILGSEHIGEIDVFCALTNDDEDNIMSSLLAKNFGAKRVVTIVNRSSYVDLLVGNTIDIVISPHLATIGSILAHIRKGDIVTVHPLRRGEAEVIETIIHGDRKTSKIVGRPHSQIKWPHGCYLCAIIRSKEYISLHNNIEFQEGDHLIFFVSRRQVIKELEKMLQVKLGFF